MAFCPKEELDQEISYDTPRLGCAVCSFFTGDWLADFRIWILAFVDKLVVDHPSQRLVVVIDGVSLSHLQGPKLCYDIRAKALSTCEEITDGWNLSELSTLLLREHLGPILIAKPADTTGRLCRFVVGFALPKCILPAISYYSRKIVWASALLRG